MIYHHLSIFSSGGAFPFSFPIFFFFLFLFLLQTKADGGCGCSSATWEKKSQNYFLNRTKSNAVEMDACS
jgi:hypothetical protein